MADCERTARHGEVNWIDRRSQHFDDLASRISHISRLGDTADLAYYRGSQPNLRNRSLTLA